MHTAFAPQSAVCILTREFDYDIAITAMIVFIDVNNRYSPTATFGITLIHGNQHTRKVFCIVATGAGHDGERGTEAVVLPFPGRLVFQSLQFFNHRLSDLRVIPKVRATHGALDFRHAVSHCLSSFLIHIYV